MKKTFLKAVVIGCLICVFLLMPLNVRVNLKASTFNPGIFNPGVENSEIAARFAPVLNQIAGWANNGDIVGAEIMVIENRDIIIHEAYG